MTYELSYLGTQSTQQHWLMSDEKTLRRTLIDFFAWPEKEFWTALKALRDSGEYVRQGEHPMLVTAR